MNADGPSRPRTTFVIFTDDHEPAHVHAIGGGGEAKIDLGPAGGSPRLVWVVGLTSGEVRRAMAEVGRERDAMVAAGRGYTETTDHDRRQLDI